MQVRSIIACLALAVTGVAGAQAPSFKETSTRGRPRSDGLVVRVSHPAEWREVISDDEMALAELRGPHGRLTGILQIGRGLRRKDTEALCAPERAQTMLKDITAEDPDVLVTDVVARKHEGRPAYEVAYQRNSAPVFMRVRSVIVCTKDSQVVVSCAGGGAAKSALAEIEPVCRQVLDSLSISEE